jgi:uncharacterized protein YecE (DUF72 family)
VPARFWLTYYASQFDTVEINLTFYRRPTPAAVRKWKEAVPPHFAFTLKASQTITHHKRLENCEDELEHMVLDFAPLETQLGCVLFQLPPSLRFSESLLERFGNHLASKLAGAKIHPHCAIEFRHSSWNRPDVLEQLASRGWAMVIHDMQQAGSWRVSETQLRAETISLSHTEFLARSSPWLYLRFHGATGRYAGEYGEGGLKPWAALARSALRLGFPLHASFNNTQACAAAHDALRLKQMVSI